MSRLYGTIRADIFPPSDEYSPRRFRKAVEGVNAPPCDNCQHCAMCARDGLACHDFRRYARGALFSSDDHPGRVPELSASWGDDE